MLEKVKEAIMPVLAYAVTFGFFVIVAAAMFVEIPQENKEVFNLLTGAAIGMVSTVIGYFFGSSEATKKGGN